MHKFRIMKIVVIISACITLIAMGCIMLFMYQDSNETVDIEDDNFEESRRGLKFGLTVAAWAMLCVIAYLLFGCFGVCGGWAFGWIVFLTVPIYASVGEAIAKRNAEEFCYPVFVTLVYLILGLEFTWWHPGWIIFLTVPVYYTICHAIKKLRK